MPWQGEVEQVGCQCQESVTPHQYVILSNYQVEGGLKNNNEDRGVDKANMEKLPLLLWHNKNIAQ